MIMATPVKIDPEKLHELLNLGKKGIEIAEVFGVTPSAVTQAKMKLGVALAVASAEVEEEEIDSTYPDAEKHQFVQVEPLKANERKKDSTKPIITKQVRPNSCATVAPRIIKDAAGAAETISALIVRLENELEWIDDFVPKAVNDRFKSWRELNIKNIAEIRKLITTLADIEFKLHHVNTVQKALTIMLDEIGNESKETQQRIRDRLAKASILVRLSD